MKKNRFIRISKRVMVLLLCCSLVSGACFNKYKVTANAAAMTATLGSYAAYEICLYIGGALLATCGLGAAYENRDQIAEVGKNFIDSLNLDEVSGWMLSKVNTTGQSYVYGTEALKEVQDMGFSVIQGGGNMPENNNDNDDDGDIDADDRTKELEQMGMWATTYLVEIIEDGVKPLIEGIRNGEETILDSFLYPEDFSSTFNGFVKDENGFYSYSLIDSSKYSNGDLTIAELVPSYKDYIYPLCFVFVNVSGGMEVYELYAFVNESLIKGSNYSNIICDVYTNGSLTSSRFNLATLRVGPCGTSSNPGIRSFSTNIPVFGSLSDAQFAFYNNDFSNVLGVSKTYQIADWLQEHWTSALEQLNTGIRSLADNMLIVGEAANQALIYQSNGLGYIEDLGNRIATTAPLALPDSIADPEYYPADSSVPALAPEELPWNVPVVSPDSGQTPGTDSTPESGEDVVIGDYAIDLRKLFPFCIPFDFIELLRVLDAEPEAPRFEIPFVVPSVGIDEMYVIDLSMFDDVMEIIRLFELVGFVIGLMLLTGKVIKW